ncbi:hypothetical protein [Actinophytocola oryzae]|uniref:Uncharacterized protein n=1 Tax=Actinophytocola oryzae TaxID=502181 RepID=A0A4R7USJ0_9PSEU|nr:hypothetical protein [Actinophytocola oryzae]TDV38748.1 hypothetical protein CLV71_126137 [Actinophytocola oryzae]
MTEDPARRFLDETVPKHDEWDGREPEDGPARPRHVQHPADPLAPLTAKERRANALRNVAWGVGSTAAFAAGAALSDDDADTDISRDDGGFDAGGDFGEAGSGL